MDAKLVSECCQGAVTTDVDGWGYICLECLDYCNAINSDLFIDKNNYDN